MHFAQFQQVLCLAGFTSKSPNSVLKPFSVKRAFFLTAASLVSVALLEQHLPLGIFGEFDGIKLNDKGRPRDNTWHLEVLNKCQGFFLLVRSHHKRKDFQSSEKKNFIFFFWSCPIDKIISLQKLSVSLFGLNKSVPNTSQQFPSYFQLL